MDESALNRLQNELAEVKDQLAASSDVLDAIGRSASDVDAVLGTVVDSARQLCHADVAQIHLVEAGILVLARSSGLSEAGVEFMARHPVGPDRQSLIGRVQLYGTVQQITDVLTDPDYARADLQRLSGLRTVLGVPMRLNGELVGVLVVWRNEVKPFGGRETEVLSTFATQAAIAILNARLFRELEAASRHKSEFLASMSHELRTPLNAVIGFSEVLLERMFGDLNERQEEYLHDILDSGRHLLELLNDILDLSKVEAGRMQLERSRFVVSEVVDACMSQVSPRAAQQDIELRRDVAAAVGVVDADELRFKQVLLNLLSNAVKFTRNGGTVDVRVTTDGTELTVTVTDTGIGIAPEDLDRIFESFQQGDRATTQQEGTGLGLALSKRIVELFGGRMWVDSAVGVGSTFGFTMPIGVSAGAGASTPPVPHDGRELVVVVEDDRRSLELLTLYLESAGLRVLGVGDGLAGMEAVRRQRPAAVVLDIHLPDLDGWDVLAALKADPSTVAVPVVIVSIVDERGRGFALGADEYLVKPVSRDDVLSALARVRALPDRGTLLAIDDDPMSVELVKTALQPAGWTVVTAADGATGIVLARSRKPTAILLDLLMPGIDGLTVVEVLRADPETADIPIVVLTAKELSATDKERLTGRISSVAQKGDFDQAQLIELVRRAAANHLTTPADRP
jgi:signal transduction histidine kinase/DNA-binding response OmpR family regulator